MPIQPKVYDALLKPLNGNRVKKLQGKYSYLEAWDVKRHLIRFFGYGGFDSIVESQEILSTKERYSQKKGEEGKVDGYHVTAMVRLRLTIHNVVPVYAPVKWGDQEVLPPQIVGWGPATYVEVACATNTSNTLGDALDTAVKAAESDALKRAAINLGTQFGLSLYDDGSTSDVVRFTACPPEGWVHPDDRPKDADPGLPNDDAPVRGTPEGSESPVPTEPPAPGETPDEPPNASEDQTDERVAALVARIQAAAGESTVAKRMKALSPIVNECSANGARTWVTADGTTIGRLLDLALNGKLKDA